MGKYQRHVLYFSRKFYLRQFDLFPKVKISIRVVSIPFKNLVCPPEKKTDLRFRSFDLLPPTRPVYNGYARYETLNLVSRNYSIRTYCTSSISILLPEAICSRWFFLERRALSTTRFPQILLILGIKFSAGLPRDFLGTLSK